MYLSFANEAINKAEEKVEALEEQLELAKVALDEANSLQYNIEKRVESLVDEIRNYIDDQVYEVSEEIMFEYNLSNPYDETGMELREIIESEVKDSI